MSNQVLEESNARANARTRLYGLLELQTQVEKQFKNEAYNIFVFGSYLTTKYVEGKSDIDIAIYTEDFNLYKRLAIYLEEHFNRMGIASDIFFIDTTMEAPVYCAPLKSKVQFTDYYPPQLVAFEEACRHKLEEARKRLVG